MLLGDVVLAVQVNVVNLYFIISWHKGSHVVTALMGFEVENTYPHMGYLHRVHRKSQFHEVRNSRVGQSQEHRQLKPRPLNGMWISDLSVPVAQS